MATKSKCSTASLIPAVSLSAKLRKIMEEDSSNFLKENLAQVKDLAELKCDLKQMHEKMTCYED